MHFHLPKPLHGWREFAGEVGIIVIGVLVALGAEQVVEAFHWKMEVDDARAALRTELDHDLGAVAYRQAQQPCVVRRMEAVDAWLTSLRSGHPITLTDGIAGLSNYSIHSSVWEIVKTGQAAAHMPLTDKVAYSQIYDVLQNIWNLELTERDAWRTLADADGARSLNDADTRRVKNAAARVRSMSLVYANNLDEIAQPVARLGLKPDRLKDYYPDRTQRFCKSILPPKA
jgi:hypothetical protein